MARAARSRVRRGATTLAGMHVVGPIIGDVVTPESDSTNPVWWVVIGIGVALVIAGVLRTVVRRRRSGS